MSFTHIFRSVPALLFAFIALGYAGCARDTTSARPTSPTVADSAASPSSFATVRREGSAVIVIIKDPQRYKTIQCRDTPTLEKLVDGNWVPLVDEVPPSHQLAAFFIGDSYMETPGDEGCDVVMCGELAKEVHFGEPIEYVRTGTRAAPADSTHAGELISVYEARPVSVPVRASLTFYSDAHCETPRTAYFSL
jgi:hypothetical protein